MTGTEVEIILSTFGCGILIGFTTDCLASYLMSILPKSMAQYKHLTHDEAIKIQQDLDALLIHALLIHMKQHANDAEVPYRSGYRAPPL